MKDSTKKVAKALAEAKVRQEIEAEIGALTEKQHAIIEADEAIFSEISRWTGIPVARGERIPIVRDGVKVGELPKTRLGDCPVHQVASASLIEHKSEIERKISALQAVIKAAGALSEALAGMSYLDRAGLNNGTWWARNALRGDVAPLEERLIKEIGLVTSAAISAKALSTTANTQMEGLREELEKREVKLGRPRNEAAHAVARELALLYAKITGKEPTYAEGPDGLSGEFTPALRNVFDKLGWHKTGLKGPAQAAINAVTEADMQYEETRFAPLFSTVPSG